MEMNKITFKQIDEQNIDILLDGKKVGHVSTPASSLHDNSVQICGFDEAYDLWGCGIFGERLPDKITWEEIHKDAPIYQEGFMDKEERNRYVKEGYFKFENDKWYKKVIEQQWKMKKDIQFIFSNINKSVDEIGIYHKHKILDYCLRCYSSPCYCMGKVIQTKRAIDIKK